MLHAYSGLWKDPWVGPHVGYSERLWSFDEVIAKIDELAPAPKPRGRYKKVRMMEGDEGGYWTFSQWTDATVRKIVTVADGVSHEQRASWLDVQIRLAIMQALRHGRSGRADDDPVAR